MIYINDHIEDLSIEESMKLISEQRRQTVMAISNEAVRRQSLGAYLLLQEGLRDEYHIAEAPVFAYHQGGKPYLADHPHLHFSMSHSRKAVACAIAQHPVGVDIETIRPYNPTLARHVLSSDELEEVEQAAHPALSFIRLWTMKESVLKLTGEGLRMPLPNVLTTYRDICFQTIINQPAGYVCTIATQQQ